MSSNKGKEERQNRSQEKEEKLFNFLCVWVCVCVCVWVQEAGVAWQGKAGVKEREIRRRNGILY